MTANGTTIATLGPAVRLVVFKFLTRSELVPDFIPRIPVNSSGFTPATRGEEVLPPTPKVWLAGLRTGLLNSHGNYLLVGTRVIGERVSKVKTKWIHGKPVNEEIWTSDVRFTFCHRNHVSGEPHPDFAERFDDIVNTFVDWTRSNLWNTMAHLNPYFNLDSGSAVNGASILMFGCAGRTPTINPDGTPVMVYEGGREKSAIPGQIGQGIGPKVPLLNVSSEIKMSGNKVLFIPRSR